MWDRKQLKANAKELIKPNVVKIFVWNPLVVGAQKMFLNCKTDRCRAVP